MNSGIYLIVNMITQKYYIGSAINLDDRWRLHKLELNRNNHHNRHLQSAWNKYGEENFRIYVLEHCVDLDIKEQFWIEKLNATDHEKGYNICRYLRNRYGVKISEETRKKLSESHKGHKQSEETKAKRRALMLGNQINKNRKQSEEEIEKRRLSNIGKKRSVEAKARMSIAQKGKIVSEEARQKMRLAKLGKKHTQEAIENMKWSRENLSQETRLKLSMAAKKRWNCREEVDGWTNKWL